jgi:hypothetical protein
LTSEQLRPERGIDGRLQTFALEGWVGFVLLEKIENDVPDDGEVQGREVLSRPATIFVEGYV